MGDNKLFFFTKLNYDDLFKIQRKNACDRFKTLRVRVVSAFVINTSTEQLVHYRYLNITIFIYLLKSII